MDSTIKGYSRIGATEITDNPIKLIGTEWMLITAGTLDSHNTMTASWGTMGVLWNKQVAFCFIRPPRHTFQFVEREGYYTLSFFGEEHRDMLKFCGSRSGRDVNKTKECNLTPLATPAGSVSFDEARLILECRKLYTQDIDPAKFVDPVLHDIYPLKDYHRMYVGEITGSFIKVV